MFKTTLTTLGLLAIFATSTTAQVVTLPVRVEQAKQEVECRDGKLPSFTYEAKLGSVGAWFTYLDKIECLNKPTTHKVIGVPGNPSFETKFDMNIFMLNAPAFFAKKEVAENKKP
jgi:hypothetical protein